LSDGAPRDPIVFAVSDATGETAEQACRAALAQFSQEEMTRVRVLAHVRDEAQVEAAVKIAKEHGGILAYTLVQPDVRGFMKQVAAREGIVAIDILSTLISALARHLQRDPLSLPGLGHQLDAEYFRRVEAIEFAVNNDDGRLPRNLKNAEIVLVGLSRTSKTPLSNYLAHRGYRVANVPIVVESPLPRELDEVDPRRVFGLMVEPTVLANVRRSRMRTLRMEPTSAYGDADQIRREVQHARRIFAEHPEWTVIDMTERAIEETASYILETYRERFEPATTPAAEPPAPKRRATRAKKP
jgi:regulator of PEP synthase PpsR (kinase-PPPase family)